MDSTETSEITQTPEETLKGMTFAQDAMDKISRMGFTRNGKPFESERDATTGKINKDSVNGKIIFDISIDLQPIIAMIDKGEGLTDTQKDALQRKKGVVLETIAFADALRRVMLQNSEQNQINVPMDLISKMENSGINLAEFSRAAILLLPENGKNLPPVNEISTPEELRAAGFPEILLKNIKDANKNLKAAGKISPSAILHDMAVTTSTYSFDTAAA